MATPAKSAEGLPDDLDFGVPKDLDFGEPAPKKEEEPSLLDKAVAYTDPIHLAKLAVGTEESPMESVGRLRAGVQGLTGGLFGKAAGALDPALEQEYKKAEQEHPGMALAGSAGLGGRLGQALPGVQGSGVLPAAARVAQNVATGAGLNTLQNATHDRPLTENLGKTAALTGGLSTVAEGLGGLANSPGFRQWVANRAAGLNQSAGFRALKALGAKMVNLKGATLGDPDKAAELGNRAMDMGLVPPGASRETMSNLAEEAVNHAGGAIGKALDAADAPRPGEPLPQKAPFNNREALGRVENEVLSPMHETPPLRPEEERIRTALGSPDEYPGTTFNQANKTKTALGDTVSKFDTPARTKSASQAYGVYNDAIEKQMAPRLTPQQLAEFLKAKKDYGTAKVADLLANQKYRTEVGNRILSPSDQAIGAEMGIGDILHGDPIEKAGGLGKQYLAAALHKLVRERGPSIAAHAARGLANTVSELPQSVSNVSRAAVPSMTPAALQIAQYLKAKKDAENGPQEIQ